MTSSSLSIILTREDNQRSLRCQAENKLIPGSSIQSSLQLEVRFPPRVSLRWGANIDGANIAAGQDIYMECVTSANPPVSRIQWLHDGYRVEASRGQGVLISGLSLVIQVSLISVPCNTGQKTFSMFQSVAPGHSGNYSCVASNTEGDAVSSLLRLEVQHSPVCSGPGLQTIQLPLHLQAEVVCRVRAHPPPTSWWWTFNNSVSMDSVSRDKFSTNSTESVLRYTPLTPQVK